MRIKLYILLIIIFLFIGDIERNTYRTSIDGYKGFYGITNNMTGELLPYENHTININIGDNMVWINDDPSDRLTVISDQNLWRDNVAILPGRGEFNYTFNNTGIYTFHIEQYKKLPKQIIIVSDDNTNNSIGDTNETNYIPTPTISPTETVTENITISPTENVTENITISPTENVTKTISPTINIANMANENTISTNPILMPLNILSNIKITGFVSFIIILIIFFIKE